jgi:hypothetical protein
MGARLARSLSIHKGCDYPVPRILHGPCIGCPIGFCMTDRRPIHLRSFGLVPAVLPVQEVALTCRQQFPVDTAARGRTNGDTRAKRCGAPRIGLTLPGARPRRMMCNGPPVGQAPGTLWVSVAGLLALQPNRRSMMLLERTSLPHYPASPLALHSGPMNVGGCRGRRHAGCLPRCVETGCYAPRCSSCWGFLYAWPVTSAMTCLIWV